MATDDTAFDEEIELDFINKMGQAVPRFADMITGYATNPGTIHFFYCILVLIISSLHMLWIFQFRASFHLK